MADTAWRLTAKGVACAKILDLRRDGFLGYDDIDGLLGAFADAAYETFVMARVEHNKYDHGDNGGTASRRCKVDACERRRFDGELFERLASALGQKP